MKLILRLIHYYVFRRPWKGLNILRSFFRGFFVLPLYIKKDVSCWPTTLIFRSTSRCNLRCIQCGQWGEHAYVKNEMLENEMTTGDFKRIIDDIAGKVLHLSFQGGEPFVKKDMTEIIRYAARKNFTTQIVTNGTLLSQYAESLVSSEVDYIVVSLDGPEQVHNTIRKGIGNAFKETEQGLSALAEFKAKLKKPIPIIAVAMTLTEQNQNHIYETYELVRSMDVQIFHIQFGIFTTEAIVQASSQRYEEAFHSPPPKSWGGFIRDVSAFDTINIKKQIEEIREDIKRTHSHLIYRQTPGFECDIHRYYRDPEIFVSNDRCTLPWKYAQVMPNGDLTFCLDLVNVTFGNILQNGLKNVWNSSKAKKFRAHLNQKGLFPVCSRCDTYMEALNPCLITTAMIFNREGRIMKQRTSKTSA